MAKKKKMGKKEKKDKQRSKLLGRGLARKAADATMKRNKKVKELLKKVK